MTNDLARLSKQIKDRITEIESREKDKVHNGLYRRYDNKYAIVTEVSDLIVNYFTSRVVSYYFIDIPNSIYSIGYADFIGDTYLAFDGEGEGTEMPIVSHPDNVTGQETMFKRVDNIDRLEKSMTTSELMAELRMRKDCPLFDLDIDGIGDEVEYVDYPIARLMNRNGEFMDVATVYDNEREAIDFKAKYEGDNQFSYKTYKRTWREVN